METARQIILWNRIGQICEILMQRLGCTATQALDIFYRSQTSIALRNEATGLYLMSNAFLTDEVEREKSQS